MGNAVNYEYQRKKDKIKQDVKRAIETTSESEQKLHELKDLAEKSLIQVRDQKERLGKMNVFINKMPESSQYIPSTSIDGYMETLSTLMVYNVQNANRQLFVINNTLGHMRGAFASTTVVSGTLDPSGNVILSIAGEISSYYPQILESLRDFTEPTESEARENIERLLRSIDFLLADKFREAFRTFSDGNFMSASHAMRDVLSALAQKLDPDKKVMKMRWYKQDPTTKGPTQSQRIKYAIIGQSSENEIGDEEIDAIDRLANEGREIYQKLSSEAHKREGNWERERVRQYLSIGQNVIKEILLLRGMFFTQSD